jgi:hypothetical protein
LVIIGLLVFLTDPLLTLHTKVANFDCLALPFVFAGLILIQKQKLSSKDVFFLVGVFFISFFIKIPTIYFFLFFLVASLVVYRQEKLKSKKLSKILVVLFLTIGVTVLILHLLLPEMFRDILFSHLLRPRMLTSKRIGFLFNAFYFSPITLLSASILAIFFLFLSRNKQTKCFSLFFLLFLLFSVFVPKHFYRHHLIMIIPMGIILGLVIIEKSVIFLKVKDRNWLKFLSVFGALLLTLHFFLWMVTLFYFNPVREEVYKKVKRTKGTLFTNNNFYYMITEKEPYFWYFVTIPDGPCRWGDTCFMHKKILAKSDYALLDSGVWIHVSDKGFYQYLHENFYLDFYNRESGLMLYLRRKKISPKTHHPRLFGGDGFG